MNWHDRYSQQAQWTGELRSYLLARSKFPDAHRVLELGCGTGAVLGALPQTDAIIHGLDMNRAALGECRQHAPRSRLTCGDVLALPYPRGCFDITFCHYLLLWINDPLRALSEMKRVTAASGYVIAFAEPDYGARVDHPAELAQLGAQQNRALQRQGAALRRGAELAALFREAGIRILETGTIEPFDSHSLTAADWESEWRVLEADLATDIPVKDLERLRELDGKAMQLGQHMLSVPTYFAWGQV